MERKRKQGISGNSNLSISFKGKATVILHCSSRKNLYQLESDYCNKLFPGTDILDTLEYSVAQGKKKFKTI